MSQTYRTEHVEFPTNDGLSLPGLWFTPATPTSKTVIYLHGCGSSSVFYKTAKMQVFAQTLTDAGYNFLAFNNRGAHYIKKYSPLTLDSEDPNQKKEDVFLGTALEQIADAQHDITAAVDFAHNRGTTDITLLGESTGANKICVYDALMPHNPVSRYALAGGGDDWGLWFQHFGADRYETIYQQALEKVSAGQGNELISTQVSHQVMSYQSLVDLLDPDGWYNCFPFFEYSQQDQWSTRPLFHAFRGILKPTLVLYGEHDAFTHVGAARAQEILHEVHPEPDCLTHMIVADADHSFHGKETEEILAVRDWLMAASE